MTTLAAASAAVAPPVQAVRDVSKATTHGLTLRSIENGRLSGGSACNHLPAALIQTLAIREATVGANLATVDMPYDSASTYVECHPVDPGAYERLWVSAIRSAGMHVWFRQTWNNWWPLYQAPKLTYATKPAVPYESSGGISAVLDGSDTNSYLARTYRFVRVNPDLFMSGDIFTPESEADGDGIGPEVTCHLCMFPSMSELNRFLRDSIRLDRYAFQQLGLNVTVGLFGTSCGDLNRLEPETVAVMGVVSTDCYARTADELASRLNAMHSAYGVPIVLSEWGDIWDGGSQPATNQLIDAVFRVLLRSRFVVGVDYWQGVGGPGGEGLFDLPALSINAVGQDLAHWYRLAGGAASGHDAFEPRAS